MGEVAEWSKMEEHKVRMIEVGQRKGGWKVGME